MNNALLNNVQLATNCIASSKKIIFIIGAGISTSCGLSEFRSKKGLYNLVDNDKTPMFIQDVNIAMAMTKSV